MDIVAGARRARGAVGAGIALRTVGLLGSSGPGRRRQRCEIGIFYFHNFALISLLRTTTLPVPSGVSTIARRFLTTNPLGKSLIRPSPRVLPLALGHCIASIMAGILCVIRSAGS